MFYVMSDIHGCYQELEEALTHWNQNTETLIILGDLIDRGPDSLKVIQRLRELQSANPDRVIVLQGNHDEGFVSWLLDTPEAELGFYYMPYHDATIRSFYGHEPENIEKFKRDTRKQRGQHIRYHFMKELHFMQSLPKSFETDHCIFVHAGINLNIKNWRDDTRCMNHIRNPFIFAKKKAPKRVFFGHTPTALIRDNHHNCAIWTSKQGDKVGIDGGCAFGHQLNAVKINQHGDITETIVVRYKERIPHGV